MKNYYKRQGILYVDGKINQSRGYKNYKHTHVWQQRPQIYEQKLMKLKIEISTIVFEKFNTPLSIMDRTTRHKIISK